MSIKENSLFHPNSLAQSSVDWNAIHCKILAKSLFKPSMQERMQNPLHDTDVIEMHFNKIDELLLDFDHYMLLHEKLGLSVNHEFLIEKIFSSSREIQNQGLLEIHEIYRFIEFFLDNRKDLGNHEIPKEIINQIQDFRLAVTPDGQVKYERHPRFKKIMLEIFDIENEARTTIRRHIQKLSKENILQNDQHDIINDRYVISVKSDAYQASQGRIISRSARFKTLYIEPPLIKSYSDQRSLLLSKLQEHIYLFEKENIETIIKLKPIIDIVIQEIFDFDYFFTKTFFASSYSLTRPDLLKEKQIIIKDLFHPLLQNPVKNSFHLKPEVNHLVISGPNTGGKSVFMKTVALSYLFISKGLYVPAKEARLFYPEHAFYIGNLNENIELGLSSFSGEVDALLSILEESDGSSSIVFADEIFNSTSSEEASSIACGILDELSSVSSSISFVSTHHTSLKNIAGERDGYEVCHFGFDASKNRPNYLLKWGQSGESKAISILKNSGSRFLKNILGHIQHTMDKSYIDYEKLAEKLKKKLILADKENSKIELLKEELLNKTKRAENELNLFKQRETQKVKRKIDVILTTAQKAVKELKQGKKSEIKKVYESKREVALLDEETRLPTSKKLNIGRRVEITDLVLEKKYYSELLDCLVTLKSINPRKKLVQILSAGKTITHPAHLLFQSTAPSPNYGKKQLPPEGKTILHSSNTQIEHDCRGMRLEEFQKLIEEILTSLDTEEVPFLSIIHGHGTGALKSWLRDFITKSENYLLEIPEGNDGSSIIKLEN